MFESLGTQLKLPDLWQHQAVNHLREGRDVIVDAPTGAGKTYVFELLHQSKELPGQAVYTVPTRALANDKYAEWKERGWDVGISTGDVSENTGAPVVVATLETQLERLLRGDGPACLVMDEYQMIADHSRGAGYEGTIALAPAHTRLLLLSGSVANPGEVAEWMRRLDRQVEVVVTRDRPVPLDEMPLDRLPMHIARNFSGYWAKLAAAVIAADLAPLLIFSPRRKDAEGIAKMLARELPASDPLHLTPEQRTACGRDLSALLEKRVAYHHSGLSYAARAGVIEPLAKAGQLRVIAATMGLAAGINFSVRSVHVASTTFHDGTQEQKLAPDDLLQMFGRAGRRGLDERGYIITTDESPGLGDARPAKLRRSGLLAWSMFLRVMKHAALRNDPTFAAAVRFASRLFAKDAPSLGIEPAPPTGSPLEKLSHPEGQVAFGLAPTQRQVLNALGQWESHRKQPPKRVLLGDAWIATEQRQGPALLEPRFMASLGQGVARIFKGNQRYGLEVVLGTPLPDMPSVFKPTRTLRRLLKLGNHVEDLSVDEFQHRHVHKLARRLLPEIAALKTKQPEPEELPEFAGLLQRPDSIIARYDLYRVPVMAYEDQTGHWLLNPEERVITLQSETEVLLRLDGEAEAHPVDPRPGSAVYAWRSLGLIDAAGVPTRRGEIVSFFQHGEGLAIVAALENESYPMDRLVPHMANLRAGSRFEIVGYTESEMLGTVCRQAYGFVNYHGYLSNGLPTDYGEGACEVLEALISGDRRATSAIAQHFSEGDVLRAFIEWLSLIRHVVHAPAHPWSRWQALQEECGVMLKRHAKTLRHLFHLELPPLTVKQRATKMKHMLGRF